MPSPYSYSWTAAFSTPAKLTGLSLIADLDDIAIAASVTPSGDAFHYEYVWEAQVDDDPWAEIGRTTDPAITWYLANLNRDVRIRVSDSNGALFSTPLEAVNRIDFKHWVLTHVDGDFVEPLENDLFGTTIRSELDRVSLQPLSGLDTDTQLPIVFTGQWKGERISLSLLVLAERTSLIATLRAAAREPLGKVALKDPDGGVWIVALGDLDRTDLGAGNRSVSIQGVRVG